jgi:zinc transport system substrate-binding protein
LPRCPTSSTSSIGRLENVSQHIGNQYLLGNHPAWNYLAKRYGWKVKSFHLELDTLIDADALAELKAFLADHSAEYILWEAEPAVEVAAKLEQELGLKSIVFDPCETLEEDKRAAGHNFLTVMNNNVTRLEDAFLPEEADETDMEEG